MMEILGYGNYPNNKIFLDDFYILNRDLDSVNINSMYLDLDFYTRGNKDIRIMVGEGHMLHSQK